jgi:hypothetical protein
MRSVTCKHQPGKLAGEPLHRRILCGCGELGPREKTCGFRLCALRFGDRRLFVFNGWLLTPTAEGKINFKSKTVGVSANLMHQSVLQRNPNSMTGQ